jgi:hypothetical protein
MTLGAEAILARLAAVEERLAAMESPSRPAPDAARDPADGERFWALQGLKARAAGRSVVLFTGAVTLAGDKTYEWQQGADVDAVLGAAGDPLAASLSALGHPARLTLLRQVLEGATSSAELGASEGFGTSGQLYHHLRELTATGWLRSSGRGRYEVPATRVVPLLVVLAACQR